MKVKLSKCPHCMTFAPPEWTQRSPDGLSKCSQCGAESLNPAWIVFHDRSERPIAEHDKRREWWIPFQMRNGRKVHFQELQTMELPNTTHVREVRPGEITLTREELNGLIDKHTDGLKTENYNKTFLKNQLLAELFPEGTEVTK